MNHRIYEHLIVHHPLWSSAPWWGYVLVILTGIALLKFGMWVAGVLDEIYSWFFGGKR